MYRQDMITLLSTDATDLLEDCTALLAFLRQTAQEYAGETSTNDWLKGYHKGRETAFAQAAQWQQEILNKLRSLLEPD